MGKLYNRFEELVESDRFSIKQRLAAVALGTTVLIGGVQTAAHFELDEHIIDGAASILGYDSPIEHDD